MWTTGQSRSTPAIEVSRKGGQRLNKIPQRCFGLQDSWGLPLAHSKRLAAQGCPALPLCCLTSCNIDLRSFLIGVLLHFFQPLEQEPWPSPTANMPALANLTLSVFRQKGYTSQQLLAWSMKAGTTTNWLLPFQVLTMTKIRIGVARKVKRRKTEVSKT